MTLEQMLAFGLVGATIIAFMCGRFRYDLVALVALVAGLAIGIIPAKEAFSGFQNDVTVIIACALIVSAAFSHSGLVEAVLSRLMPYLKSERSQVPVLTLLVTVLSMATKNVGALAIMMPVALQVCRKTRTSPSRLLMPMAFGAMAGGMVTLVGTAPNIIVSEVRDDILGKPFEMFDYTPVGITLTALTLIFLMFGYRLLPKNRSGAVSMEEALVSNAYLTEASVPEDWPLKSKSVSKLIAMSGGDVHIMALIRKGKRYTQPKGNLLVRVDDVLLLEGAPEALERFITQTKLKLIRNDRPITMEQPTEEINVIEAVIGTNSKLTGMMVKKANLYEEYGVNLLGVSRSGYQMTNYLRSTKLQAGDIILLQGSEQKLPLALQALELLPLAERDVRLGGARRRYLPAIILILAMTLVGFGVLPVAIAFFGAAVLTVALGGLKIRDAYAALDGPLLVLIAALIPVSDAIQQTGGADLIASGLQAVFNGIPGVLAIGGVMFAAMAITPFLNNAATVLIVAPIGASLAGQLGFNPDPFLMAVACGAACDFLTPIGHQCNTLVMGPAGYKFSDYPRLGAPLSLLMLVVGPPLILFFWPL